MKTLYSILILLSLTLLFLPSCGPDCADTCDHIWDHCGYLAFEINKFVFMSDCKAMCEGSLSEGDQDCVITQSECNAIQSCNEAIITVFPEVSCEDQCESQCEEQCSSQCEELTEDECNTNCLTPCLTPCYAECSDDEAEAAEETAE